MKKILILLTFALVSCKPTPEFYINNKPYYTRTYCVENHTETTFGYHWGYSVLQGKWCWHFGEYEENICDQYRTDTIEIK